LHHTSRECSKCRNTHKELKQMKLNRKHVVTGLVATGLVAGALAGGGAALAATGPAPAPATSATSATAEPFHGMGASHFGGMHGMRSGQQPGLAAAATYLGLTQTQLRDQLQAGKSLTDVAAAQGKPVSGLKDAILAAMTSHINASSALTADQKAAMLSQMKSHLDAMVNMTYSSGEGMSRMGSPMSGMGSSMSGMWQ